MGSLSRVSAHSASIFNETLKQVVLVVFKWDAVSLSAWKKGLGAKELPD